MTPGKAYPLISQAYEYLNIDLLNPQDIDVESILEFAKDDPHSITVEINSWQSSRNDSRIKKFTLRCASWHDPSGQTMIKYSSDDYKTCSRIFLVKDKRGRVFGLTFDEFRETFLTESEEA